MDSTFENNQTDFTNDTACFLRIRNSLYSFIGLQSNSN